MKSGLGGHEVLRNSTGLQLGKGVLKILIASMCPKLLDLALKINYCCSSSLW